MNQVRTEYRQEIGAYLVSFPSEVSLNALKIWGSGFTLELQARSGPAGLLVDTNTHAFESTDCLKWLRKFFTEEPVLRHKINRVTFVQPVQYRAPEIVNESEAYFSTVEEACEWLSKRSRALGFHCN